MSADPTPVPHPPSSPGSEGVRADRVLAKWIGPSGSLSAAAALLAHGGEYGVTIHPDGSLSPASPPSADTPEAVGGGGLTEDVLSILELAGWLYDWMTEDDDDHALEQPREYDRVEAWETVRRIRDLADRLASSTAGQGEEGVVAWEGKRWRWVHAADDRSLTSDQFSAAEPGYLVPLSPSPDADERTEP